MSLYSISSKDLQEVKEKPFKLEREIQNLVEANLEKLMGLKLVKSEFAHGNLRIDTLAYDEAASAFVVIEFKRGSNYSVVDQGMSYLGLMLNNKAEFILEYNERFKCSKKKNDIDWSQSKVIFVSPSFTTYQREAINFKDLPIEIWEIHRYANNIIRLDQLQQSTAVASFKSISKKSVVAAEISKQVMTYTEEDYFKGASADVVELYGVLKEKILSLGPGITIKPMKLYIAFRSKTNFTDIVILKKSLKIFINLRKGQLNDPKKILEDVSQKGHWANGDYQLIIDSDDLIDDLISFIKQSYIANS